MRSLLVILFGLGLWVRPGFADVRLTFAHQGEALARDLTATLRQSLAGDETPDLHDVLTSLVRLNRYVQDCTFEADACAARAASVVRAQVSTVVTALGPLTPDQRVRVSRTLAALGHEVSGARFSRRVRGPARVRKERLRSALVTEACVQAGALSLLVDGAVGGAAVGCGVLSLNLAGALFIGNLVTGLIILWGQEDERRALRIDDAPAVIGAPAFACAADLLK